MVESLGKAYKPWLIVLVLMFVGSLALLTLAVGGWFYSFDAGVTPLWVTVAGVFAVLGFLASVAGALALMGIAAVRAARAEKAKAAAPVTAETEP